MSEILSPAAFEAEVRLLVGELIRLVHEYRDAHGPAHSPQVMETANVTADHSNIPHSLAGQKERLKGELRNSCEMVRRMRTGKKRRDGTILAPGVEQQVDWLMSALEGSEQRHGVRFDPVRNARSLDPTGAEHARLLEAQRRRRERGETA